MKLDWSKAPEWAQFHACDADGDNDGEVQCYWFERKPYKIAKYRIWYLDEPYRYEYHRNERLTIDWQDTLQEI